MIEEYYNKLAPFYKLLYQDWNASVRRQGSALNDVIREFFGARASRILDAACGIGTQAIGLAELGYIVRASDLSPTAVSLARAEAGKRGLRIHFEVADLRHLSELVPDQFDLVIACDNAIPHLLSESEILQAFQHFYRCTSPTGGCIISVRDYAALGPVDTQIYPRAVHITAGGRVILFDLWQGDGEFYDFTTYAVEDDGSQKAITHVISGGRYYRVSISTLEALLKQAGFTKVTTIRDRFFQPLILGFRIDHE